MKVYRVIILGVIALLGFTAPLYAYQYVGGDNSCQQCHTNYTTGTDWHTNHLTNAQNDCTKCHDSTQQVPTTSCVACHAQAVGTIVAAGTDGCGWVNGHNSSGQSICLSCHTACETTPGTCAAGYVLGNNDSRLETLRKFRDEVLAKSSTGKALIAIYYKTGDAIIKFLETHPAIKQSAAKILESFAAVIEPVVGK